MEDKESNYTSPVINKKEFIPAQHTIKQKIWCDKQKHIFYNSGRPIFNSFNDNKHLFYKKSKNGKYIGLYY